MPLGKNSFHIMTVQGIPIKLDISWLIIFVLVTWTFASVHFPSFLSDNSSLLRISSISDWRKFILELRNESNPVNERILQFLGNKNLTTIKSYQSGSELQQQSKVAIINSFNDIIRDRDFYNEKAFEKIQLDKESLVLLKKGTDKLTQKEVRRFNRLLLQAVFPGVIKTDTNKIPGWILWLMSAVSAILLFISILLHEMSHSLVAQKTGLPIKEITLFIFGGVAQMTEEPTDPRQEFVIAIAGPTMSLLLVIFFGVSYLLVKFYYGISLFADMLQHLTVMNLLMIAFNMVPGLPLDGGRVLRAALWWFTNDLYKSTKISSALGKGFGLMLTLLGVFSLIGGQTIGGIWFAIIGMFLYQAAKSSLDSIQITGLLEGVPVEDALFTNFLNVPAETTLYELAHYYFLKNPYKGYPIFKTIEVNSYIPPENPESITETSPGNDNDSDEQKNLSDLAGKAFNSQPGINEDKMDDETSGKTENNRGEKKTIARVEKFLGIISLKDLLAIRKDLWNEITAEELVKTKPDDNRIVNGRYPMKEALKRLMQENISYLVVVENEEIKGILTYRNVMNLITIRSALVRIPNNNRK